MYRTALSPTEVKFRNRLKYLVLNKQPKEISIIERLKNLFKNSSSEEVYVEIKGVCYRFFLTPEIIELNKKRKKMLLKFFERYIQNIYPDHDFDLLNSVILPGISERYFYYLLVARFIRSIDVMYQDLLNTMNLLQIKILKIQLFKIIQGINGMQSK